MNYYQGNIEKDYRREFNKRGGWIVGHFMDGKRKTSDVAIKFWKFNKGQEKGHSLKYEKKAVECTFIMRGEVRAMIDGTEITLKAGDYVVIPPTIKSNTIMEVIKPVEGFTVKAPSMPKKDSVKLSSHEK